ncbi:MAG: cytochrome-c peroxidase [Rhodothermales bacterium]|nr:cytochrome-c peroxidase [Rhodothermales bacterium]
MGILLLVLALLLGAGCSAAPVEEAPSEDLDQVLTDLMTRNGQRRLSAFRQPDSGDFAAIPQFAGNPLTPEKVRLGQLLFHEPALATRPVVADNAGTYSCATCHHAAAGFQAGQPRSIGEGGIGWGVRGEARRPGPSADAPGLRSPSVLNVAFQDVLSWNGQNGALGQNLNTDAHWVEGTPSEVNARGYDGVEAQAVAALTTHRMSNFYDDSVILTNETYRDLWNQVYPHEQNINRDALGFVLAAYERTLFPNRAPFQRWIRGEFSAMTDAEKRGAIVFFGESGCETCHTGPGLSGPGFYALGMPDMPGGESPALGRGGFLDDPSMYRTFKVPQLYNMEDSPFLGHGGTFPSVESVVRYYNDGIPAVPLPEGVLEGRFRPLNLTEEEVQDLTAFLRDALRDPELDRYAPDALPTGNCFPAADAAARRDLGCQ